MQPEELRVGNYYIIDRYGDQRIVKMDCNEIYDIIGRDAFDEVTPIPLTDEWMEKLGFESDEIVNEDQDEISFYRDRRCNLNFTLDFQPISWVTESLKYKLEYVHQLQNLYFAINGENLDKMKL